jgi:deoxyribonuclease-4
MPYLPNLSAPYGDLYKKSIDILSEEIYRCTMLDIPYLVSHLGKGSENGINQLMKACNHAFDNYKSSYQKIVPVTVLLENSAGQKNSIGNSFEEIRPILDKLGSRKFGVCLDTCHAFASGYDLMTKTGVDKTIEYFNKTIGLKEMKAVHMNDFEGDLNSHSDRHEHIGLGKIGEIGFATLFEHSEVRNLPIIVETPIDQKRGDPENLKVVMNLIRQ